MGVDKRFDILTAMAPVIIGVDEAGRGPLAGPVAVGVVAASPGLNLRRMFPGLNDSKQLSPRKRAEIYDEALRRAKAGDIKFCVRLSPALYIDTFGIVRAVRRSVWSGVRALSPDTRGVKIFLDGLLAAPPEYEQETIIKGDALVPVISLASIVAKVTRDRVMERLSKKYPEYGFERHKGYGTLSHYRAIKLHGLCDIHRRTYCKMKETSV